MLSKRSIQSIRFHYTSPPGYVCHAQVENYCLTPFENSLLFLFLNLEHGKQYSVINHKLARHKVDFDICLSD